MFFLGDTACIDEVEPQFEGIPSLMKKDFGIANLESAIVWSGLRTPKSSCVYSTEKVINILAELNVKIVSLANNHIFDVPEAFENTIKFLKKNNILHCGAGHNYEEAARPVFYVQEEIEYAFFAFGWDVIGCKYATKKKAGVNPLILDNILECIKQVQNNKSNVRIVLLMHWDYELEQLPMPMQKEIAHVAIDAGAYAVIGTHPHCVQNVEKYNNRVIAYSLGNWFLPQNIYFNKRLVFPQYSKDELVIQFKGENVYCHYFRYNTENQYVRYKNSISNIQISCEANIQSIKDYKKYFRQNRTKRKCLPIFCLEDGKAIYHLQTIFVKIRHICLSVIFMLHLRNRTH